MKMDNDRKGYGMTDVDIARTEREIVDRETGEVMHVDEIKKCTGSPKAFWKMYLTDFLGVLGIVESKQLDVFIYIADNTNPATNIFIGTQQSIADACRCSRTTVSTMLGKLQKQGFVQMVQAGVYFVNPNVMMKGNESKRQMLITWERSDFANHDTISMIRGDREPLPSGIEGSMRGLEAASDDEKGFANGYL